MKIRYIAKIMKGDRGAGLLSIHAKSKVEAKRMAQNIVGQKPWNLTCESVESFRGFEKRVRLNAVNELITRASPFDHKGRLKGRRL